MQSRSFTRFISLFFSSLLLSLLVLPMYSNAATIKPNTLTVGIEVAYPPFESWDNGNLVGFDVEMAKLISEEMNLTPQYLDTAFSNLILGLNSKHYDMVISAIYITETRQKQADAVPYAATGAYIIAAKDSEIQPKTAQDLCGLTVGFQQGNAWISIIQNLSTDYCLKNNKQPIGIREFPTAPEAIQSLMSKNTQASIEMAGAARVFEQKSRGRVVISSPDILWPQTLGIYINKNNQELYSAVEKALASLKQNGKLDALFAKYAAYGIEPVTP